MESGAGYEVFPASVLPSRHEKVVFHESGPGFQFLDASLTLGCRARSTAGKIDDGLMMRRTHRETCAEVQRLHWNDICAKLRSSPGATRAIAKQLARYQGSQIAKNKLCVAERPSVRNQSNLPPYANIAVEADAPVELARPSRTRHNERFLPLTVHDASGIWAKELTPLLTSLPRSLSTSTPLSRIASLSTVSPAFQQ
ncbi:hypothetical protein BDZ45DRAFT_685471 [Acephala macrosclerotiorum]|nr:hypothetical protein BDZ45DRAFT_685471 [Acephala macrosclerotiorum]